MYLVDWEVRNYTWSEGEERGRQKNCKKIGTKKAGKETYSNTVK